jgi:hypothetical protein
MCQRPLEIASFEEVSTVGLEADVIGAFVDLRVLEREVAAHLDECVDVGRGG